MKGARSHPHPRPPLAAALVLGAVLWAAAPGPAAAATPPPGAIVDVVRIQDVRGQLRFAAPPSVHEGDYLEVVNETDPAKLGPHTFSLVGPGWLPKTKRARRLCFARHHVCRAIANWHGVAGEGPPTVNPAGAGPEGWSTMGNPFRAGDSWFTGTRPGASIVQQVSVDASLGPRTIYFMCAIHPEMQGRIEVLPSPVPAA